MKYHYSKVSSGNLANFFLEGDKYYNFYLKLIEEATESIHLQTYIFEMDSFGKQVHAALIYAADRGVKVYLLIDSFGSKSFNSQDEANLSSKKINFKRFNSLNFKWFYQWGRRLHHKVLIIDQQKAIIGGINVTKSSFVNEQPSKHLDFAVYLEGPILLEMTEYCESVFMKSNPKYKIHYHQKTQMKVANTDQLVDLKLSINDWVFRRRQITKRYSMLITNAEKEITIISSYFFPRKKFMKMLVQAAERGVRVRLILPKISDWPSYILASEYLYLYFLKNNVEIYQWNKSILHGKLAIIDNKYSTLGSFNLNYTSYQQNLEMNIDVESELFTKNLNNVINELIITGCDKINLEKFKNETSIKIRFFRLFYYLVLAAIANFSISLIYQEDNNLFHRNKYFSKLRIFGAWFFFITAVLCLFFSSFSLVLILFSICFLLIYFQLIFNKRLNN